MMKPNFALTLSSDGIGLLHRVASGWHAVGEVSPDSADLAAELRGLRAKAAALDPTGLRCKIVLPNDQIRYIGVTVGADADPRAVARSTLDGATPYAVEDLVFDWTTGEDGTLQIAAVARETLDEAEGFATEHDFTPLCFVAIPDVADFSAEPWFGESRHAAGILPKGERVERDRRPIRIVGTAAVPVPDAVPVPKPEIAKAEPEAKTVQPSAESAGDSRAPTPPPEKPASPTAPVTATPEKPGPIAAAVTPAASKAVPPPKARSPEPADVAPVAFASIRASRGDTVPESSPRVDSPTRLKGLTIPEGPSVGAAAKPAQKAQPRDRGKLVVAPMPDHVAETGASLRPDPEARLQRPAEPQPASASPAPTSGRPWSFLTRRRRGKIEPAPPASSDARSDVLQQARQQREAERRRMTVFGARHEQVGGKPRYLGLILMALLVLFLVSVAAWASIYLEDGLARLFGTPEDIRVSDIRAQPEPESAPAPETRAEPDALASGAPSTQGPDAGLSAGGGSEATDQMQQLAALQPQDDSGTAPDGQVAPDGPAAPATDGATAIDDSMTSYAVSGIWQTAPEPPAVPSGPTDVENLLPVPQDAPVELQDATTLPDASGTRIDEALPAPADPPAADTRFVLDGRGLVQASPDGAMTPEGVTVFEGAPPVVPPAGRYLPRDTDSGAAQGTEPAPRLASLRPEPRPDDLIADADPAATDAASSEASAEQAGAETAPEEAAAGQTPDASGATIAFAADADAVSPRPRARPASLVAADETAGLAVDDDAVAAAVADAAASETDAERAARAGLFANATAQAVSSSLVPRQRPQQFAAIVQETRTARAQEPVSPQQTLSPSLPTSASVSKSATDQNAIDLRKMNLIGVYGAPNSRRALVRLSNGRYKKVKVGDTLDGGQVAAIGDGELRYVKRGKALVLRMPQG